MLKGLAALLAGGLFFATVPNTSNYSLQDYGFGSGGGAQSTSNYSLQGITGEIGGSAQSTSNYTTKPGFIETEQANVPLITLSNPSNYYDKLTFAINNTSPNNPNNPSDALYALQVKVGDATCDFTTGTIRYVQNDNTLGTSLVTADYQTYSTWVSSGQQMIGLTANTTYCIRAKVTQGKYTESAYGPSSSSAATVGQSISFCLYTTSCGSGNSVSFGSIPVNTPTSGLSTIKTEFATNADFGGNVYIYSANAALKSTSLSTTIPSATADLTVATQGFGAQVPSAPTVTTGGPLTVAIPFNVSSNNVGIVTTTAAVLLTSSNPLTGGIATTVLKAKTSNTTVAANDYTELLTFIAAASF